MTDKSFEKLIRELGLHLRREAVTSLLIGNDTQCFSQEQYVQKYVKKNLGDNKSTERWIERWIEWIRELAPMHLRSVGCEEVKPGIWIKKEFRGEKDGRT